MSLINKMLRDLDARQSTDAVADVPHGLALLVEPEAPKKNGRSVQLALGGLVIVLLVVLTSDAWWPDFEDKVWPRAAIEVESDAVAVPSPQQQVAIVNQRGLATASVAFEGRSSSPQHDSISTPLAVTTARTVPVEHASIWSRLSHGITLGSSKSQTREAGALDKLSATRESTVSVGGLKLDTSLSKAMEQLAAIPPVSSVVVPVSSASIADSAKTDVSRLTSNAKTGLSGGASTGVINKTLRDPSHLTASELGEEAYRKGVSAYKLGRMTEATAQLQTALQEAPGHAAARQTLLSLYIEQKHLDEAQTLLKEGLVLLPAQTAWAIISARIHVERGNYVAAWDVLQRHMEYAGNNADYHGFSGVILQRLKKSSEAIPHYQRALELRPNEGRWWFGLGAALDADNRGAEALEAYHRALTAGNLTSEMMTVIEQRAK